MPWILSHKLRSDRLIEEKKREATRKVLIEQKRRAEKERQNEKEKAERVLERTKSAVSAVADEKGRGQAGSAQNQVCRICGKCL